MMMGGCCFFSEDLCVFCVVVIVDEDIVVCGEECVVDGEVDVLCVCGDEGVFVDEFVYSGVVWEEGRGWGFIISDGGGLK